MRELVSEARGRIDGVQVKGRWYTVKDQRATGERSVGYR